MASTITGLLWFAAIGCGLMAGLYFAFSTFIMRALGSIEPAQGIAAMNAINAIIVRSSFLPLFFGTTIVSVVLIGIGLVHADMAGAGAMLAGGIAYFVGMFLVTIVFNVPLNNALAVPGPGQETLWQQYLRRWTLWNHVRTTASTAACGLFILALRSH